MSALISQYESIVKLQIDSMLDSLFSNKVVTFKQKQTIEKQSEDGMKWFLDNVIISSLEQGMIIKYGGFIKVMEKHDDAMLRKMAKSLVSEVMMCCYVYYNYIHNCMVTVQVWFLKEYYSAGTI